MTIVELVVASEPDGLSLGELSNSIGPKSSVHGLAKGLVAVGYLREQGGKYFAGPAVFSLLGSNRPTLPAAYHHAMQELTDQWGETTVIATLVGDSAVYVDSVESDKLVRAVPKLNTRMSLWPRSAGKCLLAFMEPRRRDAILRRTIAIPADREQAVEQLVKVRETLVAINIGETEPGNAGVASPILNAAGNAVFVLSMAGPRTRMTPNLEQIIESVRSSAASLSSSSN